jgi:uncharacterized protein (TIGR01244 family)
MTHSGSILAVSALIATSTGGAAAQRLTGPHPTGPIPVPVLLDTTGLFNVRFAKVGDDLFIAGQPTVRGMRDLKSRGVTTIVNLRTPVEMSKIGFDEAAVAAELGMDYVYLPVRGDTVYPYSPKALAGFTSAMKSANGKVLLHCTVAWRASHLWAAYLINARGVAPDTAIANAHLINLMDDMATRGQRQPIEQFLGHDIPELWKGKAPRGD